MKKGVTLIEILVSALILTIGISGILYSFVTCNQIVINNTHRHNAVQIINGHFEEIQRCESPAALNDYLKLTIGDSLLVKKQIINNKFTHLINVCFKNRVNYTMNRR
ncbi:MAG: prepilin-type N-terminal cleavage/methylation domain-containing protein, partial [Candidatus Delongbacteria bacterium]|nr:prepilin-type N-terminal cleavage/methylation domain-containing protein [Candidatus Delongbacteria bacterium]